MAQRGHLYVIDGDLTKLACDAWLLPTDPSRSITTTWQDMIRDGDLEPVHNERGSRRLKAGTWSPTGSRLVSLYTGPSDVPLYLAHIGGASTEAIAQAAVDFLREARPAAMERAAAARRRPLLALNHMGSGQGGHRARKGSALDALLTRLDGELSGEMSDVDVVLVAWGQVAESASQFLRRGLIGTGLASDPRWQFHPAMHAHIIDAAEKIAANLRQNRVSIFMGAGVSAGAGLQGWDDLLEDVGRVTDPPTTGEELRGLNDNRDAASLLQQRLTGTGLRLESLLSERLQGNNRFSLQHGLLASLPCSEYITTNVDSLFELAAGQDGSTPLREIPHHIVHAGDRWILKLHGSVSRPESLVFTREHYIDSFKANRALVGLVQSMLLTRHMLFVGYGLRDEDFHELVHEVRTARGSGSVTGPMGTVLALFADEARSDLWRGTVDILPMRPAPPDDCPEDVREREFQSAVRDLERFLDLVGMLAVDTTKFVLDPSYGTAQDHALVSATEPLIRALNARGTEHDDDAWRQIRDVMRALGADV